MDSIRSSVQGEWHGSKAFVFYNKTYFELSGESCRRIESSPAIAVFELETRTWSKIRLELPLNRSYYLYHIDHSDILNIVFYTKINYDSIECSAASIRIPLKKPEKLLHLCWFQLRACALSDNFAYLNSLI
jgi:hypothetical protein